MRLKKGIHPLAWVAIGCGGLSVIAVIALGLMAWSGYRAATGIISGMKSRQQFATADMVIAMIPDLEVVSKDPVAGAISVRQPSTGAQATWSTADIEAGQLTLTDAAGKLTELGAPAENRPAWLPLHEPNQDARLISQQKDATQDRGALAFATPSSAAEIIATYAAAATAAGLTNTSNFSMGGVRTVNFSAVFIPAEDHLGRSIGDPHLASNLSLLTLHIRPDGIRNQVLLVYSSVPTALSADRLPRFVAY